MNIFITGGTGFIGSHLVEFLLKKKYNVYVLYEYSFEHSKGWLKNTKNKKLKIIFGDIKDSSTYENYFKKCDIVINLAALISIPYSYNAVKSYLQTNLIGTYNLLELSRRYKIKKFIQTSTSEVYGNPKYLPIDENHPLQSSSPYAATKASADQLCLSYYFSYKLPLIIIRPFNTFGPRQSLRAVIPTIILQSIFKKKISLGKVDTRRDFTFVDDTVNGFFKAFSLNKKYFGTTINLGTGKSFKISDIIKIIEGKLDKKIQIIEDNKRIRPDKSEILNLVSNNSKAKKILKWKPKYTNFKGLSLGLEKTLRWYSDKDNLRNYNDIFDYNV